MRISDWSSDVCSSDLCSLPCRRMWRLHGRTEECARPVFGMLQFPSVSLFTRCHVLRTLEPVRKMELNNHGDMVATQNEGTDLIRPTGIYPTDLSSKTGTAV